MHVFNSQLVTHCSWEAGVVTRFVPQDARLQEAGEAAFADGEQNVEDAGARPVRHLRERSLYSSRFSNMLGPRACT
jgi:hypothetical protein